MDTSNTEKKVIQSCMLRNAQFDIYAQYAKKHGMPTKSMFVLVALYYTPEGYMQMEICQYTFSSKQTVNTIISWTLQLLSERI